MSVSRARWILLALVVLALTSIAASYIYKRNVNKLYYGKIDGISVSKADAQRFQKTNSRISQKEAGATLLDEEFYQKIAAKYGVGVSDAEVARKVKERSESDNAAYKDYLEVALKKELLQERLRSL